MELQARERYYIENNECVNKIIPNQTKKEWNEKNQEKIKEYNQEYQEKNQEKVKEYKKKYYEKNQPG
jgi:hypothetical protein